MSLLLLITTSAATEEVDTTIEFLMDSDTIVISDSDGQEIEFV